jgi:outer membrane lipoprotein-sorting protein
MMAKFLLIPVAVSISHRMPQIKYSRRMSVKCWFRVLNVVIAVGMLCNVRAAADSAEAQAALKAIRDLNDKVAGFRADLEVHDKQEGQEQVSTSALTVSKAHGWKVESYTPQGPFTFVCDFNTFYQYYPSERKVFKNSATSPDAAAMFRKPATDMNPVPLMDPRTINFKGKKEFEGHPVYHLEGTTSTQFLPEGRPVERRMEVWISAVDGLPRKSVERSSFGEGATVYRNVRLNPELTPADFQFAAPPGVAIIDADQELKKMEEQAQRAESMQSRKSAYSSATETMTSPPLLKKPNSQ